MATPAQVDVWVGLDVGSDELLASLRVLNGFGIDWPPTPRGWPAACATLSPAFPRPWSGPLGTGSLAAA